MDTKTELNNRKAILNEHLEKFNKFKKEERWSEAWEQLLITLTYANETLKFCGGILKDKTNTLENDIETIPAASPSVH